MTRRTKSQRRIYPAPPSTPRPDAEVAAESGGPLGILLWTRLGDVTVWAGVEAHDRGGLFGQISPAIEEWERLATETEIIAPAVRTLSALARYPDLVREAEVSRACATISAWALATEKRETAVQFAEAAALADPHNAMLCAEAGTACVWAAASTPTNAEHADRVAAADADRRAEIWFERGVRIGRRKGQWEWYIRCLIRAGMQAYERGEFVRARRAYRSAHSTAMWRGFPDLAGKAHHDMMLIECAVGSYERAEFHLYGALSNYPRRYQRLPHLAHDAAFMFVCWGADHAALEILDAVFPLIEKPTERIAVLGTMALATAGVGDRVRHRDAVADVLLYAALSEVNAAGALVLAAEGALKFRDWNRSAELAAYSLRIAANRCEREPQRRANRVLDLARKQVTLDYPAAPSERVRRTKGFVLDKLQNCRAPADPGETRTVRAELTKFTMSAR